MIKNIFKSVVFFTFAFSRIYMQTIFIRVYDCVKEAFPKAKKTALWIFKYMFPISLAVGLLQQTPFFDYLSEYVSPVFCYIGLSGEASVAFVSSIFVTLYTPIAIIASLGLEVRQIIILGSMCLISHNLPFETLVQKKTGSSVWKIVVLRLSMSFITAFVLNLILPQNGFGEPLFEVTQLAYDDITVFLSVWLTSSLWLSLKIFLIIFGLIVLQNILKEFYVIDWLSSRVAPLMKMMGLSKDTSFLWVVGQTLGLTYGSGILMEEMNNGLIGEEEAKALNYHLALNHSQIEDTMLFVAIGAPYLWVALPRVVGAIVVLWGRRIWLKYK